MRVDSEAIFGLSCCGSALCVELRQAALRLPPRTDLTSGKIPHDDMRLSADDLALSEEAGITLRVTQFVMARFYVYDPALAEHYPSRLLLGLSVSCAGDLSRQSKGIK